MVYSVVYVTCTPSVIAYSNSLLNTVAGRSCHSSVIVPINDLTSEVVDVGGCTFGRLEVVDVGGRRRQRSYTSDFVDVVDRIEEVPLPPLKSSIRYLFCQVFCFTIYVFYFSFIYQFTYSPIHIYSADIFYLLDQPFNYS